MVGSNGCSAIATDEFLAVAERGVRFEGCHASRKCPASSSFRPGLALRKHVEAILVVPEIVLRLEVDPDTQLATFDVHLLATLHPRAGYPADPVEDLIPARLELAVVEAGESSFEYGLKAS